MQPTPPQELATQDEILKLESQRALRQVTEREVTVAQQQAETEKEAAEAQLASDAQLVKLRAQADQQWLLNEQQRRAMSIGQVSGLGCIGLFRPGGLHLKSIPRSLHVVTVWRV